MPAVPSCLLEPLWAIFESLLPQQPQVSPTHPLGCHRRRICDRVVFELIIAALVHGSGYERVATAECSDRTIRRRLTQWAAAGITITTHAEALDAYDRMIGLRINDIPVDGCITKAPCGGNRSGPSPVDRAKGGLKRSVSTDGHGIPLGLVSAPANRHDSPLLPATLAATRQQVKALPDNITVHLDAAYDNTPTRTLLVELGFHGEISRKGIPAPIQVGKRWVCERTHSWMNAYGKLRRCTDKDATIIDFYLYLAATLVTIRQLIQRARKIYRWATQPTTRRLR